MIFVKTHYAKSYIHNRFRHKRTFTKPLYQCSNMINRFIFLFKFTAFSLGCDKSSVILKKIHLFLNNPPKNWKGCLSNGPAIRFKLSSFCNFLSNNVTMIINWIVVLRLIGWQACNICLIGGVLSSGHPLLNVINLFFILLINQLESISSFNICKFGESIPATLT